MDMEGDIPLPESAGMGVLKTGVGEDGRGLGMRCEKAMDFSSSKGCGEDVEMGDCGSEGGETVGEGRVVWRIMVARGEQRSSVSSLANQESVSVLNQYQISNSIFRFRREG